MKPVLAVVLLCGMAMASQLDSKSLFVGTSIGLGTYATRNYIAKPVAKAMVKATKKTARMTVHVVTLNKR